MLFYAVLFLSFFKSYHLNFLFDVMTLVSCILYLGSWFLVLISNSGYLNQKITP